MKKLSGLLAALILLASQNAFCESVYDTINNCQIRTWSAENGEFGQMKFKTNGMFFGGCIYRESVIGGSLKCLIDKNLKELINKHEKGDVSILGELQSILLSDCGAKNIKGIFQSIPKKNLKHMLESISLPVAKTDVSLTSIWMRGRICSACSNRNRASLLRAMTLDKSVCKYCSKIWSDAPRKAGIDSLDRLQFNVGEIEFGPGAAGDKMPDKKIESSSSVILVKTNSMIQVNDHSFGFMSDIKISNDTPGIAIIDSKETHMLIAADISIFPEKKLEITEIAERDFEKIGVCRFSKENKMLMVGDHFLWISKPDEMLGISYNKLINGKFDKNLYEDSIIRINQAKIMDLSVYKDIVWDENGIQHEWLHVFCNSKR